MTEYNKKKSIGSLFVMWPRRADEPPQEVMFKAYEQACLYCQPWALDRAVRRFIHGEAQGHAMAFRPTAPQVAQLAQSVQQTEHRLTQMQDRINSQSKAIEYKRAPKEERDRSVELWQRIKHELAKPNIAELAQAYIVRNISVPGTTFDIHGAHFPDGTHHSIEQMRLLVNAPKPNTEEHLDWQEQMDGMMQDAETY